jgi:xylulokinase
MFPGLIDTSAAMMLTRASIGQLLNVSGSTDVLGLCTDEPHPNEKLLTRALGIGRKWMSVGTLAAAGSAITWFKDQFCCELSTAEFYRLVAKLANQPSGKRGDPKSGDANPSGQVIFEPYLAGERTSIDQKYGAFHGLTLATTRDEMLAAVIDALAKASGQRLVLLKSTGAKILRHVITSGGAARSLHAVLHRDWPGRWTFKAEEEASLRGLSMVDPREK